ncbi:hypothetical protein BFJ66_g10668 [Fusarium oxysporum f. sp. cepae]|nr:hypothetical protein BFJ66_g10668 [Fusarium oxysporum f. sp. cepae]RKK86844.1 hypothetical protein BFJ71_g13637 [Fusarium oxysporum]
MVRFGAALADSAAKSARASASLNPQATIFPRKVGYRWFFLFSENLRPPTNHQDLDQAGM